MAVCSCFSRPALGNGNGGLQIVPSTAEVREQADMGRACNSLYPACRSLAAGAPVRIECDLAYLFTFCARYGCFGCRMRRFAYRKRSFVSENGSERLNLVL